MGQGKRHLHVLCVIDTEVYLILENLIGLMHLCDLRFYGLALLIWLVDLLQCFLGGPYRAYCTLFMTYWLL